MSEFVRKCLQLIYDGVPERLMGLFAKQVGLSFAGSNPAAVTYVPVVQLVRTPSL